MMTLTYILDGKVAAPEPNPAVWQTWMRTALENGTRIVAQSQVSAQLTVSTVFAGLDQGLDASPANPRPALFETAVFKAGKLVRTELHVDWDEAEIAHAALVTELGGAKRH